MDAFRIQIILKIKLVQIPFSFRLLQPDCGNDLLGKSLLFPIELLLLRFDRVIEINGFFLVFRLQQGFPCQQLAVDPHIVRVQLQRSRSDSLRFRISELRCI